MRHSFDVMMTLLLGHVSVGTSLCINVVVFCGRWICLMKNAAIISFFNGKIWKWFSSIISAESTLISLQWRHNGRDGVSNHQPRNCLLSRLFRRKSKKTSKLRVTGLCAGNSPVTGEFPAKMASNAENVSIWWRHHAVHELNPGHGRVDGSTNVMSNFFHNYEQFLCHF